MSVNVEFDEKTVISGTTLETDSGTADLKNTSGADGGKNRLKRTLKARHMSMLAFGGAIGTGLFVAAGVSFSTAGPGGVLVGYSIIGLLVYFLMQGLGEMCTYIPVSGSFQTFAARLVEPSLGFAVGWLYWYGWPLTVAAELAAAALVMQYWFPDIHSLVWVGLFFGILGGLNLLSTKAYGESEFWFAGIKVVAVSIFLVVGTLLLLGFGCESPGFSNWTIGEAPFVGGLMGVFIILLYAGYSFSGVETMAIAAGESENPRKTIPKAINSVIFRILFFYIGSMFLIGSLIAYSDPRLLQGGVESVSVSPFVLVFSKFGIPAGASLMNFVILTAVLSCGNSGLYASSRVLYSMGCEGKAPKIFGKVNRRGVPVYSVLVTMLATAFFYLIFALGSGSAYLWLTCTVGLMSFILWLIVSLCHYRFRKAFLVQGHSVDELPYKAKFFPFGALFVIALSIIVMVGQNYSAIATGDWLGIVQTYISLPVFIMIYLIHKFVTKSKIVPYDQVDFSVDND